MAKFTKTIDLYAVDSSGASNMDKVETGELVIQRGQWVNICGVDHPPSRWVGISPGGSVWAVHYQRSQSRQRTQFLGQARLAKARWQGSDSERFATNTDRTKRAG